MVGTGSQATHNPEASSDVATEFDIHEQGKYLNGPVLAQEGLEESALQGEKPNRHGDEAVKYAEPSLQTTTQIKAEVGPRKAQGSEESEEAHIERLGRERPENFKSFGAELAFCYAVLASQFMCVCYKSAFFTRMASLTWNRNIMCPASMSFFRP